MSRWLDVVAGGVNAASGGLIGLAGRLIDRAIPDPAARDAAKLELFRAEQTGDLQRLALDYQAAAAQGSSFRGGWRPAVGWICAAGLAYQVLVRPILEWLGANLGPWTPPPAVDMETLLTLLFGMLGLGTLRTVEKVRGVSR